MVSKSARTRDRILAAAAELLAERGYASITLSQIAARADLKAGSLYYHFDSKDDLVAEVLEVGVLSAQDAVTTAVTALGTDARPQQRLRVAITAHLTSTLSRGSYTKANIRSYGQIPEEVAARLRQAQRAYGRVWQDLIAEAVRGGGVRDDLDQSIVRLLLLGAMNWAVEWFDEDGAQDPAGVADQLATLVLEGLVLDGRPSVASDRGQGHPA